MEFNIKNIPLSKNDISRKLTLPSSPNKELAEFFGILSGDGYIGHYGKYYSLLEIAGDKELDYEYLLYHVSPMIKRLFNLDPKIDFKKKQNAMYLRIMSKGVNNYLKKIGFVQGKKKELTIPKWIKENDSFMKKYVRGLCDTDGCISLLKEKNKTYKYYPRIQITLINETIIQEVTDWLKRKEFKASYRKEKKLYSYKGIKRIACSYRIYLNGRIQVEKWERYIGIKNLRHYKKYEKIWDRWDLNLWSKSKPLRLPQHLDLQSSALPD